MTVSMIGAPRLDPLTTNTSSVRDRMTTLQRQLGTGQKAQTYAEVGSDRSLGIAFRQRLASLESLQSSVTLIKTRIELVDQYMNRLGEIPQSMRQQINPAEFDLQGSDQTVAQRTAAASLGEMLDILNQDINGRHLFAGADIDVRPVVSASELMDGSGSEDGFRTVLNERKRADLGADNRGRLAASTPAATTLQLDETANNIYGFKLAGISGNLTGANLTNTINAFPAASTVAVELTAQPAVGEQLSIDLDLPNGQQATLRLTATDSAAQTGEFEIGATVADTFANMQAAVLAQLEQLGQTELAAASAMQAADDFFNLATNGYPLRVDGTPETATANRDGSADTITWYSGTLNGNDPRQDIVGRIDTGMSVGYGIRAIEDGFRMAVENLAVFAAETFSQTDSDAARYQALAIDVQENLSTPPTAETIQAIHADVAAIYKAAERAEDRHSVFQATLENYVQEIEGVDTERTAVEILALQTTIEASYRATSILLDLTLSDYI